MSALELVSQITNVVYVAIFVVALRNLALRRTPTNFDIAAFFGVTTYIIAEPRAAALFGPLPVWLAALPSVLAMALPYLLLRLVDDHASVPAPVKRISELGLAASAILFLAFSGQTLPPAAVFVVIVYFAGVTLYCAIAFFRHARRAHGVTKRRMQAVSAGNFVIVAVVVLAGLVTVVPQETRGLLAGLSAIAALLSGVSYFVGFAPPPFLWRAWQEPELRAFLAQAASLPRMPTTDEIVKALEAGASATTGATATIGLWDEDRQALRFTRRNGERFDVPPGYLIAGRSYVARHTIFSFDPPRDHPEGAQIYRETGVGAAIAAPITSGDRRLGVLCVYAARPPIFAGSDIALVGLLADQAAVVLESRALIDEATRVRAHEEATRLKDDFLSSAAHDLKTPLTTLVAQAQFLERKAERDPDAPADRTGIQRLAREAKRLNALVLELLDASRLEEGKLVGQRDPLDLVDVAREVCARNPRCELDEGGPVIGSYDRARIVQVIENLVENALKYSEPGQTVRLRVWSERGEARIAVEDHGIGIPAADLPHVFERFRRGRNVDDRHYAGMGLGLYICRGIVEQHDGRIWVESSVGQGTTFQVALPLAREAIPA